MHSPLSPLPYTPSPTRSTFIGEDNEGVYRRASSDSEAEHFRFPPPRYSPRLQHLASLRPLQLHLAPPTPTWVDEKSALTMGSAAWIDTAALEAGMGRGALAVVGRPGAAERAAVLVLMGMGVVVMGLVVVGVVGGRF